MKKAIGYSILAFLLIVIMVLGSIAMGEWWLGPVTCLGAATFIGLMILAGFLIGDDNTKTE